MTNTSTQESGMSAAQIVVVFILLGAIAAGIPVVLQSFGNYVRVATESERAMNERIAANQPQEEGAAAPTPTPDMSAFTAAYLEGQNLFSSQGCVGCHSLDGSVLVGPTLQGIGDRAAERVSGQSAEEYIHNSIVNPEDYRVEGFDAVQMPANYSDLMTEEEIDALVEFLLEQ